MIKTIVYDLKNKNVIQTEGEAPKAALLETKELFIWINISDYTKEETKTVLEDLFNFHPLAIEDCLSENHYPKFNEFDNYSFLILQAAKYHPKYNGNSHKNHITERNVFFFIGKNFLVTVHKHNMLSIPEVMEECDTNPHHTIGKGIDFLLYQIIDRIIKNYSPTIDKLQKNIDKYDETAVQSLSPEMLGEIFSVRKDITGMRRILTSQLEVINRISRGECVQINPKNCIYFRDVADSVFRIIQTIDIFMDILISVKETYLSIASNNMNRISMYLTVLATLFIIPSMIVGFYGMNIKKIPLADLDYIWIIITLLIIATPMGIIAYLKKKKWF